MDYLDIAKDYLEKAKTAVQGTETEQKLANVLSRKNWGASSTELREIARLTFDWSEYGVVMKAIWNALQYTGSRWRQIFKALTLLEFLIKNGAEKCVDDAKEHIYQIRALTGFSFYNEGNEKGAGIRELSKKLIEMLGNSEHIREEREKAKALRDKYTGIGKDGMVRSDAGYSGGGSYDSGPSSFGGRYGDKSRTDKPWDAEISPKGGSNRRSSKYDSDSEDEFESSKKKKKSKKKKSKKRYESSEEEEEGDPFDDFDKEEEERPAKGKKDKGKLKIKIKAKGKSKGKKAKEENDEDLFGDMQSSNAPEPDLFGGGGDSAAQSDTFDPFGNEPAAPTGASPGSDWGGFESAPAAAPSRPAAPSAASGDDLFGEFDSAPSAAPQRPSAPSGDDLFGFDAPAAAQTTSHASPEGDLFGGSMSNGGSAMAPTTSTADSFDIFGGSAPSQPQPNNFGSFQTMAPQSSMTMASQPPQQPKMAAPKADALWGSNLVDLGNLSLDSSSKSGQTNTMSANPSMNQNQMRGMNPGGMNMPLQPQMTPGGMGSVPLQPGMQTMMPMNAQANMGNNMQQHNMNGNMMMNMQNFNQK